MRKKVLFPVYIIFLLLSAIAIANHEPWTDEVHSWNLAKASGSLYDLLQNRRYEGHPPAWYIILWVISRFTHNLLGMKMAQWSLSAGVAFLLLFKSPFPLSVRILLPFGYFFLFEYGILSRNYSLGVLLLLLLCIYLKKNDSAIKPSSDPTIKPSPDPTMKPSPQLITKPSPHPTIISGPIIVYYLMLLCLSNTHLLALLSAVSMHIYFLLSIRDTVRQPVREKAPLLVHTFLGSLVFLPALFMIFPPNDGALNTAFWIRHWNFRHLIDTGESPLRAFLPIPAWWDPHFWNTQFMINQARDQGWPGWITPCISIIVIGLCVWLLRQNKRALIFFLVNTALNGLISVCFFPLTSARYAGFLFIGFIAACWLYNNEIPFSRQHTKAINGLLTIQLIAGLFAIVQGFKMPFSNLSSMPGLIHAVPPAKSWVTDYWTMDGIVACTDTPAWCVDTKKKMSFVRWSRDIAQVEADPHRYLSGFQDFFRSRQPDTVYFLSLHSPEIIARIDPWLSDSFHLQLIDSRPGAIEEGSNPYLYRVYRIPSPADTASPANPQVPTNPPSSINLPSSASRPTPATPSSPTNPGPPVIPPSSVNPPAHEQ